MAELFLPVLSHFQNDNPWSASAGRLRYRILPTQGKDGAGGVLTAQVWEGPWAFEFSTVEEEKVFPLTQEGLDALPPWLEGWRQAIEARPKRTLAEDVARRVAPEEPEKEETP